MTYNITQKRYYKNNILVIMLVLFMFFFTKHSYASEDINVSIDSINGTSYNGDTIYSKDGLAIKGHILGLAEQTDINITIGNCSKDVYGVKDTFETYFYREIKVAICNIVFYVFNFSTLFY